MSEYVAPIEEIRAEHAQALAQTTWYTEEEWLAKFDLALAEHDRQVAERAWDEGWADRHGLPENRVLLTRDGRARNPYRAAKEGQK